MTFINYVYINLLGSKVHLPFPSIDKKLTGPCRYIQCKEVLVTSDRAPIKVDGSRNSNSGIDKRAIVKCNVSYYL